MFNDSLVPPPPHGSLSLAPDRVNIPKWQLHWQSLSCFPDNDHTSKCMMYDNDEMIHIFSNVLPHLLLRVPPSEMEESNCGWKESRTYNICSSVQICGIYNFSLLKSLIFKIIFFLRNFLLLGYICWTVGFNIFQMNVFDLRNQTKQEWFSSFLLGSGGVMSWRTKIYLISFF